MSVADIEPTPYTSGGVSIDMWTDSAGYAIFADNIVVNSIAGSGFAAPSLQPDSPLTAATPTIQSVSIKDGVAVIAWTAIPGATYRLQYTDNLTGNEWVDAQPDIVATDATASATNSVASAPQRFYRVLVVQ